MGSSDLAWLRDLLRKRQERQSMEEVGQEDSQDLQHGGGQPVGLARRGERKRGVEGRRSVGGGESGGVRRG